MRGNKLTPGSNMRWESSRMILPEWREAWLDHQKDHKKVAKPVLDEQQWDEFALVLNDCMEHNQLIKFTYWQDGLFFEVLGHCHYVNHDQRQFHVLAGEDVHYLKFDVVSNIWAR
ncbi:YolD-like family protein [Geomicrobium sp. JCM 19039]|uniref:YolD-like family protein n=1 Tax=Geomicrobium sp. JCM 19039 TaxID=1460636 RepID=UPI0006950E17|nr:YolD-like family protein [Geomicrobium sp. JCM 19039]